MKNLFIWLGNGFVFNFLTFSFRLSGCCVAYRKCTQFSVYMRQWQYFTAHALIFTNQLFCHVAKNMDPTCPNQSFLMVVNLNIFATIPVDCCLKSEFGWLLSFSVPKGIVADFSAIFADKMKSGKEFDEIPKNGLSASIQ